MARILIIDDSRTVHVALKHAFQKDGHDAVGLSNFADLAVTLERERPDVIVLDLLMPGFNGIQFARFIQRFAENPPPIILHSGSDRELARIAAREIRPFEIVPKGDSEAELRGAVARALVARRRVAPPPSPRPGLRPGSAR
jgi:DNA-binding response OmpR family regulator